MGQATFTINLPKEKWGFFCRTPFKLGVSDERFSPVTRAIAGRIYGVSKSKNDNKGLRTSCEQLQEEFGVSRATAVSALGKLKKSALIKVENRDKEGTSYEFVGDIVKRYNTIPLYLFTMDAEIDGVERRLTKAQIYVLSYIMMECKRPKNNGACKGSIARLARILDFSETTIKKTIKTLLKAGLIYRAKEDKGVNGSILTKYHVNKKLYDYEKMRKVKKTTKEKTSKVISDANARAERERYYALRKAEIERRVDKYILDAYKKVPRLRQITDNLRKMQPALARAEFEKGATYQELLKDVERLNCERDELYRANGIEARRMTSSFYVRCKKCNDTGFHPNGTGCDCWMGER